jgi:hypothetical protein
MRTTATITVLLTCAVLCGACDDDGKPTPDAGAPSGSASAPVPSARGAAPPAPSASSEDATQVELQRFTLTSAVKDKEPADKLDTGKPGTRVYGHLAVRNRTAGPRRVSLSFRVNGDERSMVDLSIDKSWSWRTWAYVTLRKEDKGELVVIAFDERGNELGKKAIPIR